jgi:large subunit ribosomal protein L25
MKSIELKGTVRDVLGKSSSKKIRASESVPCVLYGGKEYAFFSVIEKDLKEILYTPNVYLIDLNIDGQKKLAKIQALQFHPVTDGVVHIDFYEVDSDKNVVMEIPVRIEGNSIGVKEGGKLIQDKRKLKVKGLVKNLPDEVVIDVTNLGLGKSTMVGDLVGKDIQFLDLKSSPVVSVKMTRAAAAAAATPAAAAATPAPAKK